MDTTNTIYLMMENADGCVYPFPLIYMSYNFF